MMMNDINLENYVRYLETEYTQPIMVEEENEHQQQNGGRGCVSVQEQAVLLGKINSFLMDDTDVTPLTSAVPPPNAVMSVHHKPAATEKRRDKAAKAKSTAAHTLSERKRRGRINDRIKALREIIPNADKLDKATMFDKATEYVKSAELLIKRMNEEYMEEMGIDPTMVSYTGAMQQVAYYNPSVMAEAAKLVGPMWDPHLITPGLYPFHQVQLPNQDQLFYQNQNL